MSETTLKDMATSAAHGTQNPQTSGGDARQNAAARGASKAFRRLTWFLVACYVVSYLDRINIGFANLTMAADLGLTATMFGMANSVFYVAYALFEIPSNLALAKYGARLWIPRIMLTWGIASCLTMFAIGPYSLYFFRLLVGAAEAGLLPGVVLYLSYWFAARDRARANALFVAGAPLAMLIGSPISGLILLMDGFQGLKGWQWLFLMEGLPSILLGVVAYFYLVDRPAQAGWLSQDEKDGMEAAIANENAHETNVRGGQRLSWREFVNVNVILLMLIYFCNVASNNTIGTWTPLVVKELLGNSNDVLRISLVSAIVPLFTLIGIPLWSMSSDRKNDRAGHLAVGFAGSAVGWVIIAMSSSAPLKMFGLTLASVGGWSCIAVFWALATPLVTPASRPAAIGLISTAGLFASIVSPTVIGVLRDVTNSFSAGFWYVTALLLVGMLGVWLLVRREASLGQSAVPTQ
jgi:ACS family 4-hydroxyphenylacetate permease-like MFS transporter